MKRLLWYMTFVWLAAWTGCVDKVDLDLTATELPIIVEGMVTDNPGPDTVELTKAYPADGQGYRRIGIEGAKMAITDNTGVVDSLIDIKGGYYVTNTLEGLVGRVYQLTIRLKDATTGGYTFVSSTPQRMVEAGGIDRVYHEFTSRNNSETNLTENGFNVFVDASLTPSSNRRILWKFLGTYTATTDPSQIIITIPCTDPVCPTMPLPCSDGCLCCTCWYDTFEKSPIVSNPVVTGGQQLDHVFMQYIPINNFTFFDRYRVEISQMELSEEVFEFYQGIRKQADNASSLFQPPFSELKGNLTVQSGTTKVIGTFAASTVVKKHIYILRSDVPYQLAFAIEPGDCRVMAPNSTTTQPPYWE